MMHNNEDEIIDLTSLDCVNYIPSNIPKVICNAVIDLSNESFSGETSTVNINNNRNKSRKAQEHPENTIKETKDKLKAKEQTTKVGLCSICWDKLGNKPLASTKCGHVYCLVCLERSLKCNRSCPTCRCRLQGKSAYHPLYLELG